MFVCLVKVVVVVDLSVVSVCVVAQYCGCCRVGCCFVCVCLCLMRLLLRCLGCQMYVSCVVCLSDSVVLFVFVCVLCVCY